MASSSFIVNGYSLLNNPAVAGTGLLGLVNPGVSITGGSEVFEPDDIIVVEVDGLNANGEVDATSHITRITVYDSAFHYVNNDPDGLKYTYETHAGATQTGSVYSGQTGYGDTYLRFATNDLTSTDPGAPDLGTVLLAPGTDLSAVSAANPTVIDRFSAVDYNGNGHFDSSISILSDGTLLDINLSELGDGQFSPANSILTQLCVGRGTLIATPFGRVPVEALQPGDLVTTLDSAAQPIRWIGNQTVTARGDSAPIRIRKGALGNDRDLWLSPNHRILLEGAWAELLFGQPQVLVAAKHLVNDASIRPDPRDSIDYFHFMFDAHQIVLAEGCPVESLFPGDEALKAVDQASRDEILGLFPGLSEGTGGCLSRYELTRREARAWAGTA